MNLNILANHVAVEIGMDDTPATPERVLIENWLNEAVVEFLTATKCFVQTFSMPFTAGVGDYTIPVAGILSMKALYVIPATGSITILKPSKASEILRLRVSTSAAPGPFLYSLQGANLLMIYPNAASSSDSLAGIYVPRPAAMSAITDDPSNETYGGIPTEYHPAIEVYAKWKAASFDDDASSKVGQAYKQEWDERVLRARGQLNRKAGVFRAPARARNSRGPNVAATRGTDSP